MSGSHDCFRCHARAWRRRDARWVKEHVLKDMDAHASHRPQPSSRSRIRQHVPGWLHRQRSGRAPTHPADAVTAPNLGRTKRSTPINSTKPSDDAAKGPLTLTPDDRFIRVAVRKRRARFGGWDRLATTVRAPNLIWSTSRKVHNKLMHALNGNTAAGANFHELRAEPESPTAPTATVPSPASDLGASLVPHQTDVGERANDAAAGDTTATHAPDSHTGSDHTPASIPTGPPMSARFSAGDDDSDGSTSPGGHNSTAHPPATTTAAGDHVQQAAGVRPLMPAVGAQTTARTHDPDAIAAATFEAADDTTPTSDTSMSVIDAMQRLRLASHANDRSPMTAGPSTSGPLTQTTVNQRATDQHVHSGTVLPGAAASTAPTSFVAATSSGPAMSAGQSHGHVASRGSRSISPESPHMHSAPSAAGGTADRCEHRRGRFRCRNEVWACCVVPQCRRSLCAQHFGTVPPTHADDRSASRCHEHGATRAACPCRECRQHHDAARGPVTQATAELALRRQTGREPTAPLTTITILSDEDLARIAAHRAQALDRRAMRTEDAHSARVRDALNTISANREAALARKRRLHAERAVPDATRRRLHYNSRGGLAMPHGPMPDDWVPPPIPTPPASFTDGAIPEALPHRCRGHGRIRVA